MDRITDEGAESVAEFDTAHEYFYSHIEHRLAEYAGAQAVGEINLGRICPEPLTRMPLRTRLLRVSSELRSLIDTLIGIANREGRMSVKKSITH